VLDVGCWMLECEVSGVPCWMLAGISHYNVLPDIYVIRA